MSTKHSKKANDAKMRGNKAFQTGRYALAINEFSCAIFFEPTNHVLYSNRSAANASIRDYYRALEDANKCVQLKRDWAKGYSRQGLALFHLEQYEKAKRAYERGLYYDDSNESLKEGLKMVNNAVAADLNSALDGISITEDGEKKDLSDWSKDVIEQVDSCKTQ